MRAASRSAASRSTTTPSTARAGATTRTTRRSSRSATSRRAGSSCRPPPSRSRSPPSTSSTASATAPSRSPAARARSTSSKCWRRPSMQQLAAAEPPDAAALPPAGRGWGRSLAALAVGALILALFIYYSDLGEIEDHMGALGWSAPLVLLPYLIVNIFDTLGWRCTLPLAVAARVPFVSLYLTRMAGEAAHNPPAAVRGGARKVAPPA